MEVANVKTSTPSTGPKTNTTMTSSTTSMTSSLSSPVDSGVQLLDSESEATSVMSVSGTGFDSIKTVSTEQNDSPLMETKNIEEAETNELKYQMDLFEKEFGIAGIKEYLTSNKPQLNDNHWNKFDIDSKLTRIINSKSSPCLGNNLLGKFDQTTLNKSLSDDVFEMEHPIQGKFESTATETDLMNVSLTSYELLDYTSQNVILPVENDPMNISMSEEVNETLCSLLKTTTKEVEEQPPQNIPVIEPEPKLIEEQIVYRRQRKKKSKSDTPKKRVSFHEDILNSTKIDDIHINHGFVTHEPDVAHSFFQRGFIRKRDVVEGRYSWAAEGDAPFYEKKESVRKTNSDIYSRIGRFSSSTSSSSTGSVSSSIDEEDSSDENVTKPKPSLSKPKSSCLKKTSNKKKIDTKIVHEEINIPNQKSETLLDTNIFGSLKTILTFSTSVPLAERGVPEGQEDIPNEKATRRRSCTNFSFLETENTAAKEEPVKRRGNLNLEVAKSSFRLSRSEGFYPNYPIEQELPSNVILCDSNVYEHKGISYSYEYDNFQKSFEQQNKPKRPNIYRMILNEFSFFKRKPKEEAEREAREDERPKIENDALEEIAAKTDDSSTKLEWSDSEHSEMSSNARHLNSPKKKIRRANHYTVQSSFKTAPDTEAATFLSTTETVPKHSTSKSSLIDRFLKNVTLKKLLDAKSAKRRKRDAARPSLYVRPATRTDFGKGDALDVALGREIEEGVRMRRNVTTERYDPKIIRQLTRDIFKGLSPISIKLFTVRSAYTGDGATRSLLAVLTNDTLYMAGLNVTGQYRKHFQLPYVDLNTIIIGPNEQTVHLSNYDQDMQFMITTGCAKITNDFVGCLVMAMKQDSNKPKAPAIKQLNMSDMANLRRMIMKQTAVEKEEEYVYYSIVDVQELGIEIEDLSPLGPTKEGPLMFQTVDSSGGWETAFFILKAGVLYVLSSTSQRVPMKVYPLLNGACQGARRLTSPRPHTFEIIVDGQSLRLAAPDEYAASDWLQALIHAANETCYKEKIPHRSCSLLMTTKHILTVREALSCNVGSLWLDKSRHRPVDKAQALSCAAISDLISFRLPCAEESWCILEFACREVYESGGDWILYFSSNSELENFIATLQVMWDYCDEKGESFPCTTIPESDPLSKRCADVYASLKNSWSPNMVHLQFL